MPHREGSLERTQPSLKPLPPGKPYLIAICIGQGRGRHPSVLKSLEEVACAPPTALFKEGPVVYGFRSALSIGEISEAAAEAFSPATHLSWWSWGPTLVLRADTAKAWLRRKVA